MLIRSVNFHLPALTVLHLSVLHVCSDCGFVCMSHPVAALSDSRFIHCTFLCCEPLPQVTEHYNTYRYIVHNANISAKARIPKAVTMG